MQCGTVTTSPGCKLPQRVTVSEVGVPPVQAGRPLTVPKERIKRQSKSDDWFGSPFGKPPGGTVQTPSPSTSLAVTLMVIVPQLEVVNFSAWLLGGSLALKTNAVGVFGGTVCVTVFTAAGWPFTQMPPRTLGTAPVAPL